MLLPIDHGSLNCNKEISERNNVQKHYMGIHVAVGCVVDNCMHFERVEE